MNHPWKMMAEMMMMMMMMMMTMTMTMTMTAHNFWDCEWWVMVNEQHIHTHRIRPNTQKL